MSDLLLFTHGCPGQHKGSCLLFEFMKIMILFGGYFFPGEFFFLFTAFLKLYFIFKCLRRNERLPQAGNSP